MQVSRKNLLPPIVLWLKLSMLPFRSDYNYTCSCIDCNSSSSSESGQKWDKVPLFPVFFIAPLRVSGWSFVAAMYWSQAGSRLLYCLALL